MTLKLFTSCCVVAATLSIFFYSVICHIPVQLSHWTVVVFRTLCNFNRFILCKLFFVSYAFLEIFIPKTKIFLCHSLKYLSKELIFPIFLKYIFYCFCFMKNFRSQLYFVMFRFVGSLFVYMHAYHFGLHFFDCTFLPYIFCYFLQQNEK